MMIFKHQSYPTSLISTTDDRTGSHRVTITSLAGRLT